MSLLKIIILSKICFSSANYSIFNHSILLTHEKTITGKPPRYSAGGTNSDDVNSIPNLESAVPILDRHTILAMTTSQIVAGCTTDACLSANIYNNYIISKKANIDRILYYNRHT